MRRFFMAMFIGGLVALGYGGVTKVAQADGAERPNTVAFAAAGYYVWYQYPGQHGIARAPTRAITMPIRNCRD